MDKKLLAILVLLSGVLTATILYKNQDFPTVHPVEPPAKIVVERLKPTLENALSLITAEQLKEYVTKITEFDGRKAGTKENDAAAKYIGETLEQMGLKIEYHRFQFNNRPTQNVYAWIDGKSSDVVVIGAHYDHLGKGYPGADDNGSGTATVLAAAKAYAFLGKQDRTVVFQLYSAEEWGMYGSRFYCNYPTFPRDKPNIRKHIFMLNIDMVGYLGSSYCCATVTHDSAPDLGSIIGNLSHKYPFAKSITSRGGGGSDHAPFINAGVPAAWLHTGTHSNYHKPTDTADRLNYTGMEKIARYVVELTLAVVRDERAIQYNHIGFQKLGYGYDHQTEPVISH